MRIANWRSVQTTDCFALCQVAKAEEAEAKEKLHKLQREVAKTEAQYKQSERQLNTQSEISYGLKQRNDELELELAKVRRPCQICH